jgi:hypothetical protein
MGGYFSSLNATEAGGTDRARCALNGAEMQLETDKLPRRAHKLAAALLSCWVGGSHKAAVALVMAAWGGDGRHPGSR